MLFKVTVHIELNLMLDYDDEVIPLIKLKYRINLDLHFLALC